MYKKNCDHAQINAFKKTCLYLIALCEKQMRISANLPGGKNAELGIEHQFYERSFDKAVL
jgi:hypothetical protein